MVYGNHDVFIVHRLRDHQSRKLYAFRPKNRNVRIRRIEFDCDETVGVEKIDAKI
jgi:hypothetical protein